MSAFYSEDISGAVTVKSFLDNGCIEISKSYYGDEIFCSLKLVYFEHFRKKKPVKHEVDIGVSSPEELASLAHNAIMLATMWRDQLRETEGKKP
jgi:hypothetical protein